MMKIRQYFLSSFPGRFFYALAFAVAASISCSSGPPQEQVASERQANIEAIVKSYEQNARGHPAYNLYKSSCAACHGEYAAGIGKGTDAGGDKPVLMKETMPPYKFLSIVGTNDITPYYEWDIIDVVRNGNHLMPSFLDSRITNIFNVSTLSPNQMEDVADIITGPLRERQKIRRLYEDKTYGPISKRKMSAEDLNHALKYADSRLRSNRYLAKFKQTCGASECHGPDGRGVDRKRQLWNYELEKMEIIKDSPSLSRFSGHTMMGIAYDGKTHMPSFDPNAELNRRGEITLSQKELQGVVDVIYFLNQRALLQEELKSRK